MYQYAYLLSILLAAPTASQAPAAPAVEPSETIAHPDLLYATIGNEKLKLDLVLPKGPGPHPCVVCFHGGAWRGGSRKDLTKPTLFAPGGKEKGVEFSLLDMLARKGYAAASVSYRLAPGAKFPAQIIDAKTAVRFLRTNAEKYDLDPERFAALGFSAGGHLAALLGVTDSKAGFDGKLYPDASSAVQVVIDYFGPAQLSLFAETPGVNDAFMVPLLGKECRTDPKLYAYASPIEYVTKAAAPTLIIHGTADFIVPIIHSERFYDKLKDAGVKVEMLKMKGNGHGWAGDATEESAKAMLKFLDENLKKPAKK